MSREIINISDDENSAYSVEWDVYPDQDDQDIEMCTYSEPEVSSYPMRQPRLSRRLSGKEYRDFWKNTGEEARAEAEDAGRNAAYPVRWDSSPVRYEPKIGRHDKEPSMASATGEQEKKKPSRKIYEQLGELLKTLGVKMPFTEEFFEVPDNIGYLKEALSNEFKFIRDYYEKGWGERENMIVPEMTKNLGCFTILVRMGKKRYPALCDPEASVSVLALSVCKKLGIEELTPTNLEVGMEDGSSSAAEGIARNIAVQIDRHFIWDDFLVVNMIEDEDVPIILGRTFLATVKAAIDLKEGRMTFYIAGEELEYIKEKNHNPL